jgi:hypothetical protein
MPPALAELLVSQRLLSPERVQSALRAQAVAGGTLDTVLLEQGALAEAPLLEALGQASGVHPINLGDFQPNAQMAPSLPAKVAERLGVVPLSNEGNSLHVAVSYPVPTRELEELSVLLGRKLVPWVALETRVRDWTSVLYGTKLAARYATVLAALEPHRRLPEPAPAPVPTEPPAPAATAPTLTPPQPSAPQAAQPLDASEPAPILLTTKKGQTPAPFQAAPKQEEPPSSLERMLLVEIERAAQSVANEPLSPPLRPVPLAAVKPTTPVPFTPAPFTPAPFTPAPVASPAPPPKEATPNPAPAPRTPGPFGGPPAITRTPAPFAHEWTLEQARTALRAVRHDRDGVKDIILRYTRKTFDFVAMFAVIRGTAVGWDARGEGSDAQLLGQVSVPLDSPTVFRTVAMTRSSYVGPLPQDGLSHQLCYQFGRNPRTVFLFPIEVKSRIVAVLYGDNGPKPISQRRLSELLVFCQELSGIFGELILSRKQRLEQREPPPQAQTPTQTPPPVAPPATLEPAPLPAGLAPAAHPVAEAQPEDSPEAAIDHLLGPDTALRARALADLSKKPLEAARLLIERFPGPTAWSRQPVVELPEAEELGPIPAALVRLGAVAVPLLAPLLDTEDSEKRYFALLCAGNMPAAGLLPGVGRALFDLEGDVNSAARAAATSFRAVQGYAQMLRALRQELAAVDPMRRALAARALGQLKDRTAVEGLIGLTGSDDPLCAQAAVEALELITHASFGPQPQAWTAWWAENRTRRRCQWVVAALRHPELERRMLAIEELTSTVGGTFLYMAEAEPALREAAVRKWEDAVFKNPRMQELD